MPNSRNHSRRRLKLLAGTLTICAGLAVLPLASAQSAALDHAAAGHAARTEVRSAPLIIRSSRLLPSRSAAPGGSAPGQSAAQAHAAAAQPLSPAQIRKAYALPLRGASHQTIAVISAFNDPTVSSDLATFDRHFKLPACTKANGCLTVLNQQGKRSPLPSSDATNGTWVTESALGTQLAHALCQSCKILLVEASFPDTPDFSYAALAAKNAGATVVVTSFTPSEPENEDEYQIAYDGAHEAVVAATGDSGYGGPLNFPASLPEVLGVGGTTLSRNANGSYRSETAWNGTTSGCSLYENAPSWQRRIMTASGCGGLRAGADVAAMSAPGALIYASDIQGTTGGSWYQVEGTSVSAPIVGAAIGLAGSEGNTEAEKLYARQSRDPAGLHDVTAGTDASGCTQTICRSGPGWDGPTGLGTPWGLEEFLPGGPAISRRHPKITLSASGGTIRLRRSWTGSVGIANGNAFRVSGTASLQSRIRVGGRLRTIVLASRSVVRSSLQNGGLRLTIRSSERKLVARHRRLSASLVVSVKGAQGGRVLVKRALTVLAP